MPQSSQIIGVNSVTNIELNKGFLPAPIIRNADWFGMLPGLYRWLHPLPAAAIKSLKVRPYEFDHCSLPLQDSGKWPIY
ncbi:hypothetical protein D3C86_1543600 [compost metagenome]